MCIRYYLYKMASVCWLSIPLCSFWANLTSLFEEVHHHLFSSAKMRWNNTLMSICNKHCHTNTYFLVKHLMRLDSIGSEWDRMRLVWLGFGWILFRIWFWIEFRIKIQFGIKFGCDFGLDYCYNLDSMLDSKLSFTLGSTLSLTLCSTLGPTLSV